MLAFEAFPSRVNEKVTEVSKAYKRAYSSGNCTGLTPVSLLGHPSGHDEIGTITDANVGKI